jgi:hypothetical protein
MINVKFSRPRLKRGTLVIVSDMFGCFISRTRIGVCTDTPTGGNNDIIQFLMVDVDTNEVEFYCRTSGEGLRPYVEDNEDEVRKELLLVALTCPGDYMRTIAKQLMQEFGYLDGKDS